MSDILEIFGVLVLLGMFGVMVFIQVLLCRLKSGLPGLIIPMMLFTLSFLTSFVSVGSMVFFPLIVFIIPSIIQIVIYIAIRRHRKPTVSDELRNMRTQDL